MSHSSRVVRLSPRRRLAWTVFALILSSLLSLGQPITAGATNAGRIASEVPASHLPASEPSVVTRTLDFESAPARAPIRYRLAFGKGRHEVGWAPVCLKRDCKPPCPCSAQAQPSSFDIDEKGKVWVVDSAKGRVAVFAPNGSFEQAVRGGGIDYRSSDIHVTRLRKIVTGQEFFKTYYSEILPDGTVLKQPLLYRGERIGAISFFHEDEGRFSTVALIPRGEGELERVQSVELVFDSQHAHALETPGRPYAIGWLANDRSPEGRIVFKVESLLEPLHLVVKFRFRQLVDGAPRFVSGATPYDLEIDEDGTFHVLLKAGTFSRYPVSGSWYMTITREGEVSQPIRLRDPKRRDDQQQRHLALDEEGRPFYMTAGRDALLIEDLSGL